MGVKGLLRELNACMRTADLKSLKGLRVGIDGYCWLHRGAMACARDLVLEKETSKHIEYCLRQLRLFVEQNIQVVVVLDGGPLPCKGAQDELRKKRRLESRVIAQQLEAAGASTCQQHYAAAVEITPERKSFAMSSLYCMHCCVYSIKKRSRMFVFAADFVQSLFSCVKFSIMLLISSSLHLLF